MSTVDIETKIMCWKAKIHVFVIMGVHIGCGVAVVIGAIIDYFISKEKVDIIMKARGQPEGAGIVVLICLMMPGVSFCIHGLFVSCLLCCKSKYCFGYMSIIALLAGGFGMYNTISSFTGDDGLYGLFNPGAGFFNMSSIIVGVVSVVAVLDTLYCAFVLCKLSYCDRSGGGADDLYSVEEVEKSGSESASEKTRSQLATKYEKDDEN